MTEDKPESRLLGDLEYDPEHRALLHEGRVLALSHAAADVVEALTAHGGNEVSIQDLRNATGLNAREIEAATHELNDHLHDRLRIEVDRNQLTVSRDESLYSFLEELRNRKVFRVATGYAVTGWLILQIAEVVFPLIDLGGPAMRILLVVIVSGFPVAVAAAWALELTPGGLVIDWRRRRRTPEAPFDERKVDRFVIAALALVIAILVVRMWLDTEIGPPPRVVAILPFESNLTDPAEASLCQGFAEEIRVGLARLPGILVADRDVSASLVGGSRPSEIAWLVSGRCQFVGETLSVKVALTNAATGTEQWAYSDARSANELLTFQDDIAATLALELAVPVAAFRAAAAAETRDPRAYRLYLQARGYLSRPTQAGSLATAAELFNKAILQDEEFASAHAGLCETYLVQYLRNHDIELERQAESSCLRASQLGPNLPEVHVALGRLFLETGDYGAAERALLRALELKPGSIIATRELGHVLFAQNRPAQAEAMYREAIAVPTGSWRSHHAYGRFLLRRGRLGDAATQFEEVVALTPDNAPAHNNLGATYLQMGRLQDAAKSFEKVAEIEPVPSAISNYGTMLYYTGEFEAAEQQFRRAAEMSPADHRLRGNIADALFHIQGREAEAAAEYLRAAELAETRLQVSRKDAQALAAQGWYLTRVDRYDDGKQLTGQALELAPEDPEVLYMATLVAVEEGDLSGARLLLSKAIDAGYPRFLIEASPDLVILTADPQFSSEEADQ